MSSICRANSAVSPPFVARKGFARSARNIFGVALGLISISAASSSATSPCGWCVAGDAKATRQILALGRLSPNELLKQLGSRGVCIKVMGSRKPAPDKVFGWGKALSPNVPSKLVTRFGGVMGKMLCKDELPVAKSCDTIVLAQDAPYSTLLREYLHLMEARRDPAWCTAAKERWNRGGNQQDWIARRNMEWDALKVLWENRAKFKLAREDRIAIAGDLLNEALERKVFDPRAPEYVKQQEVKGYLQQALKEPSSE